MKHLVPIIASLLQLAVSAAAAGAQPHEANAVLEPAYGESLYYFYQDRHAEAIVRLMAAEAKRKINKNAADARLLQGGLYTGYGMHRRAMQLFAATLDQAETATRNRAWLQLAHLQQQRGESAAALASLSHFEETDDSDYNAQYRLLLGLLQQSQNHGDLALTAWAGVSGRSIAAAYARYNHAVLLLQQGQADEAVKLMRPLLDMKGDDAEWLALKDQARVSLGIHYLESKDTMRAREQLEQVRLNGTLSDTALLAFGWNEAERSGYQAALTPWLTLSERPVSSPAVQDALLAAPYAFWRLSAAQQAVHAFEAAVQSYTNELRRLDALGEWATSGGLIDRLLIDNISPAHGWAWRIEHAPDVADYGYLADLVNRHDFHEALKNFRDLQIQATQMEHHLRGIDSFEAMLEVRRAAYTKQLPRAVNEEKNIDTKPLEQQRDRLKERLRRVEESVDSLALADAKEYALLARLDRLGALLKTLRNGPAMTEETNAAFEKYRLLRGVIDWSIHTDYHGRLWRLRRDLTVADDALAETAYRRQSLRQAQQSAPAAFDDHAARIRDVNRRLNMLLEQTNELKAAQRRQLIEMTQRHLDDKKHALINKRAQAQYSLAQLYDRPETLTSPAKETTP